MSSGSSTPGSSESSSASNPQFPVDEPTSGAEPRPIFAPGVIPCSSTSEELLLVRVRYGIPPEYDLELPDPSDRANP